MYLLVKHIHLSTIFISFCLFFIRGIWALFWPEKLQQRWVKILPHLIDTLLLGSAITLAVLLQQYPFVDAWLTAKLLALCAYIILGSLALKRAKTTQTKTAAFAAAILCFAYIIGVALTRQVIPLG